MFLQLPDCLIKILIVEWLEKRSVGRLDSACCVREYRNDILKMLSTYTTSNVTVSNKQTGLASWMLLRQVITTSVCVGELSSRREATILVEIIRLSASAIRFVHVVKAQEFNTEGAIAQYCPNLTHLVIADVRPQRLVRILAINCNLETLDVSFSTDKAPAVIVPVLPRLTAVSISMEQSHHDK